MLHSEVRHSVAGKYYGVICAGRKLLQTCGHDHVTEHDATVCTDALMRELMEKRGKMQVTLEITHALVLLTEGTDTVYLNTTLPSATPKVAEQPLHLQFQAEYDTGAEYVRQHFHVEPEVIDARSK